MSAIMKNFLTGMVFSLSLIMGGAVMADDDVMGFGITGNNEMNTADFIALNGDTFKLVFRGQTSPMDNEDMKTGIGIFEGHISDADRQTMRNMRSALCTMKSEDMTIRPGNIAFFYPNVTCPGGRKVAGMVDFSALPRDVNLAVLSPTSDLIYTFYKTGTPVARLEASMTVEPQKDRLLFTFMFKNSGEQAISFKSPATWEGEWNPILKSSNIRISGGSRGADDDGAGAVVGKGEFVNAKEYPNDIVEIPKGNVRYLKFLVLPDNKIPPGKYGFSANVVIREMLAPEKLAGAVQFSGARVETEFLHGWPTTDAGLQQVEAKRREAMYWQTKVPGSTVTETAYYRAYGDDKATDDFPQLLHKGEKFPPRTMEKREGGTTRAIGPAKRWRWDAFPDAKVSAVTGEPCPRAGVWIPGYIAGLTTHSSRVYAQAAGPQRIAFGDPIPRLGLEDQPVTWTWIAPLA